MSALNTVTDLPIRLDEFALNIKVQGKTVLREDQLARIENIASRAREGFYHDFKSPLATPKLALVSALNGAGLRAIATEVEEGKYDE